MNKQRKNKLYRFIVIGAILGLVIGLVLYALRQNISLFYTPSEIVQGKVVGTQTLRAGGMVVKQSIRHLKNKHVILFKITDYHAMILVRYQGILPDLFREGQGVVVQGRLIDINNQPVINATTVLAKHDENYRPPELQNIQH